MGAATKIQPVSQESWHDLIKILGTQRQGFAIKTASLGRVPKKNEENTRVAISALCLIVIF